MSDRTLIDVPAWVETESTDQQAPTEGRVTVSDQAVTITFQDGEVVFPLSAVIDVQAGHASDMFGPTPPDRVPVTLAFKTDNSVSVALVATHKPVKNKFTLGLITTVLDGNDVRVRHPVRIGDARPDTSFTEGTLRLSADSLQVVAPVTARIPADSVAAFHRLSDDGDGTEQPLIAVDYVRDGTPCRSLLQPNESQTVSLLGRYLEIQTVT